MKYLMLIFGVLLPSIAFAQTVETRFVSSTPTITAGAYSANDAVGGLMTFTKACLTRTNKGEVRGVTIYDKAAVGIDTDLVLFGGNPSGTTVTDNAALDPADADLPLVVAVIPITTHKAFADNGVTQAKNISYPFYCDSTGTLYGALVTRGAPTYASTSDITLQVEFIND